MPMLPVAALEYLSDSHTIWVHGPQGTTVLRIKCTGKIIETQDCNAPEGHSDIIVQGDIRICVPSSVIK